MTQQGLVIKNTGSFYQVLCENQQLTEAKVKGNFRIKEIRSTNPVAVGDIVTVLLQADGTAWITAIQERRNFIVRKASNLSKHSHIIAANIDLAVLVVTINFPITSLVFIDRFIATAEAYSVPVSIVFNKVDRYTEEDMATLRQAETLYKSLGYDTYCISALTMEGVEAFRNCLESKTVLLSGNSGVGKSTLLNAVAAKKLARVGEISNAHNKGVHTTTYSEMFSLSNRCWLIDTPGIKGFGTIDMEKEEVGHYFKELFEYSHQCRFSNCTHINEPDCAVLAALEEGAIAQSRYISYLSILEDCDEGKYR